MIKPYNIVRTLPKKLFYDRDTEPVKWMKGDNPLAESQAVIMVEEQAVRAIAVHSATLRTGRNTMKRKTYIAVTDTTHMKSGNATRLRGPHSFEQIQDWTDELADIAYPDELREEALPPPHQNHLYKQKSHPHHTYTKNGGLPPTAP